jgi:prepilin-type N-terminal cleavage/methylation domain-containing protein
MNKVQQKSEQGRGFTIIEVVLVLAIAGLIFLMVFIALPALQRGQRDTQRKNDMSRVSTQLTAYSNSTRGSVPTSGTLGTFVSKYLGVGATNTVAGNEYVDPSGSNYTLAFNTNTTINTPALGTIYYANDQLCSDTAPGDTVTTGANPRNYTLRMKLENQAAMHCIDNR